MVRGLVAGLAAIVVAAPLAACGSTASLAGSPADHPATSAPSAPVPRGLLAEPIYTEVERRPERIVAADLDGDGRDDLVVGRNGAKRSTSNFVLRSTGDGRFTERSLADGGDTMALADLDADGAPDLVAGRDGWLSLYRGLGDGSFAEPVRHPVLGTSLVTVEAVDLDADRDLDLLAAKTGSDDVAVLLGDGSGRFAYPARSAPLVDGLGTAAVIDLAGDGSPDVAVTGHRGLTLVTNDGTGAFTRTTTIGEDSLGYPPQVRSTDLDQDGHQDLLYAGFGTVHAHLGDGRGGLGPPREVLSLRSNTPRFAVGDLDGDGFPDLVAGSDFRNRVTVALGDGRGGFGKPAHRDIGDTITDVAIADVDGDCAGDVVVGNYNRKRVAVLLNTSEPSCPDTRARGPIEPGAFPAASPAPPAALPAGMTFAPPVLTRAEGAYTPPLLADVDADGQPDLITNGGYDHRLTVRRGDADGTFGDPVHVPAPALTTPYQPPCNDTFVTGSVGGKGMAAVGQIMPPMACVGRVDVPSGLAAADLDGDGDLDLITGTANGDSVAVFAGDGAGRFAKQHRYSTGKDTAPQQVLVADLNADGFTDVVARGGQQVVLMVNDGRGELRRTPGPEVRGPIAAGDVDGDRDVDLVAVQERSGKESGYRVRVLTNDGRGRFDASTEPGELGTRSFGLQGLTLADVDGDGALDAVVGVPGRRALVLFAGDGRGGFAEGLVHRTGGAEPSAVAVGDVTGDANADLVVANTAGNDVAVLTGDGTGGFAEPVLVPTGANGPFAVFLADVDHDGATDIVTFNLEPRAASVLLARRGP